MLHDPDDTMSHLESFNLCTLSTVTCSRKLKHDVNGRGLLPIPQVNNTRNTCTIGPTNYFKLLSSQLKIFYRLPNLTALSPDDQNQIVCKMLCFNSYFNTLNVELNPTCHLLALVGAHHILHVSRIRVKRWITNKDQHVIMQNIPLKLIKTTMQIVTNTFQEKCLYSLLSISESRSWDPFTEEQINALDRVQMKAAQFTDNTKDSNWKNVAQRRIITCLCAPFKAYTGEWAWKATLHRLRKQYNFSRVG